MNNVILVGYLAREVEVEEHRGGHLVGRMVLAVPRGRQGRGRGSDFVPVVVQGRANVLAAVELGVGDHVCVSGWLAATFTDACAGRFTVAAREVAPVGGWPSAPAGAAVGRRGRGADVLQAVGSSTRVARAGRRQKLAPSRGAVDVDVADGAQPHPSTRRPYLTVLPGGLDVPVPEPVPVLDRDDGEGAGGAPRAARAVGASGRVSPRRRCP